MPLEQASEMERNSLSSRPLRFDAASVQRERPNRVFARHIEAKRLCSRFYEGKARRKCDRA
jgi:hypothetical protein